MQRAMIYFSEKSRSLSTRSAVLGLLTAGTLAISGCSGGGGGPSSGGSNTGGTIVFSSTRDGNAEIYTLNPATPNAPNRLIRDLTNPQNPGGTPVDTQPSFSGNGQRIAWISTRNFNAGDVWVMDTTGANQLRVTNTAQIEANPALSPDGSRVAFVRLGAAGAASNIFVRNIGTGAEQRLTTNTGPAGAPNLESSPYFSPDGQKVVYVSNASGIDTQNIYIANSDGTGTPQQLTTTDTVKSSPRYSPNGQRITFADNNEIYVMNANGVGAQTRLTNNAAVDTSPAFSPDGARIVFQTDRDGPANPAGGRYTELYTMSAVDGSGLVRLTNNGAFNDNSPDWK